MLTVSTGTDQTSALQKKTQVDFKLNTNKETWQIHARTNLYRVLQFYGPSYEVCEKPELLIAVVKGC